MGNVFHAGDGNLHPLIVFDRRQPGRHGAGAGRRPGDHRGVRGRRRLLSGEHGIGLEKRDYMGLVFSDDDLAAQAWLRDAFDPDGQLQPVEGAAGGVPLRRPAAPAPGGVGVSSLAATLDARPGVAIPFWPLRPRSAPTTRSAWSAAGPSGSSAGCRRRGPGRWPPRPGWSRHEPAEMIVRVRAGTTVAELSSVLAAAGQMVPLDPCDPTGPRSAGCWRSATAGCGGCGTGRCATLCSRPASSPPPGKLVKAGGPVVKNVTGFDLCRLLVGSLGTLGPAGRGGAALPAGAGRAASGSARRRRRGGVTPSTCYRRLYRPSTILWDGRVDVGAARGSPGRRGRPGGRVLGPDSTRWQGPPPAVAGLAAPACRYRRAAAAARSARSRRRRLAGRGRRRHGRIPTEPEAGDGRRRCAVAAAARAPASPICSGALKTTVRPVRPAQPGPDGGVMAS